MKNNQLTWIHIMELWDGFNLQFKVLIKIYLWHGTEVWHDLDFGLAWSWYSLSCDVFAIPAYMPMLKECSSRWKCWVGSDKTRLESRQGCQTRPRPSETSLTRLCTGSPSMHTDWSGSKSMLSSETVRTRRLEPRRREMATKLWDHTV